MADFDDGDGDSGDLVSNKPWMGVAIPFSIVVAIIFCCVVVFYHRRNIKMQRNGLSLDQQGRMALQRDILPDGGTRPRMNGYYGSSSNYGFRDHRNYHGQEGYYLPNTSGHQQHRSARETGGRRQPRVVNRWAWTSTAERGIRNARTAAQPEGLDEHGQAPPPYMRYDDPQDKMAAETRAVEEHIELSSNMVLAPAPAHIRSGSGRGSDGETAEVGSSRTASTPASTSATTADRLSPPQAGSSLATSPTPSAASTLPLALPPAYSDVTMPKRPN
ncbi:phenylalanyl-trna beta subunit [Ophiostoma piceae UAMH 11346]|uniref:Phenylalanyl-trna beta subunit n=1 Tax=Ophiostoma piceae (strain UAMH 11346) TaxID=1262450 RepID=S3C968_OPHP1|nr:phenylalanyl-trna beta subunit [Ophiostoma piceae UAMH 11346]